MTTTTQGKFTYIMPITLVLVYTSGSGSYILVVRSGVVVVVVVVVPS